MHDAAASFIKRARQFIIEQQGEEPKFVDGFEVVEIGSRDINGKASTFWGEHRSWYGIDIAEGPNVDEVGDAAVVLDRMSDDDTIYFDLSISAEVFEHASNWREIMRGMYYVSTYQIVTCAGRGRAPHSAIDGGHVRPHEYYANVEMAEMEEVLSKIGAVPLLIEHNRVAGDLYVLSY